MWCRNLFVADFNLWNLVCKLITSSFTHLISLVYTNTSAMRNVCSASIYRYIEIHIYKYHTPGNWDQYDNHQSAECEDSVINLWYIDVDIWWLSGTDCIIYNALVRVMYLYDTSRRHPAIDIQSRPAWGFWSNFLRYFFCLIFIIIELPFSRFISSSYLTSACD